MSDEEIINSIKMGYDGGIIELYRLNLRGIINHVKMKGGREEDAKDIFQEIIIDFRRKVIENRFIASPSAKISTFLYKACSYKWLNERRKRNKMSNEEPPDIPEDFWKYEEEKRELSEQQDLFKEGMQKLGERCKRILQFYCDRVPMIEIAIRLGFEGGEQVARNEKAKCQKKLVELIGNQK